MEGHLHPDDWARQHAEKGADDEAALAPATEALLRAAHVGPGSRVLDVACGAGATAAAATTAGADALGIDTSRAMVEIARARFPSTRFEEGDMRSPPTGPWDVIVSRMGAHHAEDWLAAAHDVLAPGGRLAIAERDGTDPESRAKGMKSLREWMELLEQAGFEDVTATATPADLDGRVFVVCGRRPGARRSRPRSVARPPR